MSTPSWQRGPSAGADQTSLRRSNLALVLRGLRDEGPRSRARLGGRPRSQQGHRLQPGRRARRARPGPRRRRPSAAPSAGPATTVELDGRRVCGVGAEINVNHVATVALDLPARWSPSARDLPRHRRLRPPRCVIDLAELVCSGARCATSTRAACPPVAVTVGIAGLDRPRHRSRPDARRPTSGWHDVPVADDAARPLGGPPYPIVIDNEANLAASPRPSPGDPRRRDILVIYGEVGVGGGIVADGRQLRGASATPASSATSIVDPQGRRCGCGRRRLLGDRGRPARAARRWPPTPTTRSVPPTSTLEARLDEINRRADARRRPHARRAARGRRHGLGVGAALLANALNPGVIVLSGYFAEVGRVAAATPWTTRAGRGRARAAAPAAPASSCRRSASPPPSAAARPSPSSRLRRPHVRTPGVTYRRARERSRDQPRAARRCWRCAASSSASRACSPSTASTSRCARARCTACSARTAPASPR